MRRFGRILSLPVMAGMLFGLCGFLPQAQDTQAVHPTPASATADPGVLKGSTYLYRGYRFDLHAVADPAAQPGLLAEIRHQTDLVEATPLSEATKQFFRGFVVHVSEGEGEHGGGGLFSREGVAVSLLPHPDDRPILLHEFLHAYQHARLPGRMRNPEVLKYFGRAQTPGLWPAGAYMLKNPGEFFAMTGSTFLCGHAARPPFTKALLEQKQPEYSAWLSANLR